MTTPSACPHCGAVHHYTCDSTVTWKCYSTLRRLESPQRTERTPQCYENEIAALRSAGHILAMRLLQSSLSIEDDERAAMDAFLPQPETTETKV